MAVRREDVESWLLAYGRAWQTRDADAAAGLFTTDVEYLETPFDAPALGRDEVRRYWAENTAVQANVRFSADVLAVLEDRAIVRWQAEYSRIPTGGGVRLDGIFVLDFGSDGRCRRLREWWHRSAGSER